MRQPMNAETFGKITLGRGSVELRMEDFPGILHALRVVELMQAEVDSLKVSWKTVADAAERAESSGKDDLALEFKKAANYLAADRASIEHWLKEGL